MRNRLIGVAIGLVIAVGIVALHARQIGYQRPRLLSEIYGPMRVIAIQYTRDAAEFTGPCYRSFLSQMNPDTRVIVVCGDEADQKSFEDEVERRLPSPREIETVIVGKPITTWCKDRFLVGMGRPAELYHPPSEATSLSTRTNDALVAPALARSFSDRLRAVEVPLKFDAGDILPAGSRIIVSDTLWRKNEKPVRFEAGLKRMFGMDVIWLKDVPDHHIGMFAAPLDEETMVVGDPHLGKKLWSREAERALGKPDFSEVATAPFERAANQLENAGFRIIRAPLVVLGPKTYVSYTNGVFETRGRYKIVYMPSYGVKAVDDAGRIAYESAGWEVRPIPVRTVYKFRGTIGCLVNVLERG